MFTLIRFTLVLLCCIGPVAAEDAAKSEAAACEEGFKPLVTGESLAGWSGDPQWFRVEERAIVAGTLERPIPHNAFLCSEREYEDFELRLEAKLLGQGDNAGVQFRTRRIPDSHEVSGYQADMGTAWDRPVWGALYDESRRRRMLAEPAADAVREVLREGDWNELRIRCQGPRIQIWLNGLQTVDYTEEEAGIERSGRVCLQIHSGPPAEAWYRNVRIKEFAESESAE